MAVRWTPEQRDRWRAAAARDGARDFSTWVRQQLDRAAGYTPGGHARIPTSDRPGQARRWNDPVPAQEPMPPCPHVSKHKGRSGLPVCDDCGKVNP